MSIKSVFVSYADQDQRLLASLCRDLDGLGFQFWHDHHLEDEQGWWDTTLEKINQSDVFLMVLSLDSLHSICCQREYEYALALRKPLLAVQVVEDMDASLLDHRIPSIHLISFFKHSREELASLARGLYCLPKPQRAPVSTITPLSPIVELHGQLLTAREMDAEQQILFLSQLKKALSDKDKNSATTLLKRFRQRSDLLHATAVNVDDLLQNMAQNTSLSSQTDVIVCEESDIVNNASTPSAGEQRYFDHVSFVWIPKGEFVMGSPESELGRHADEQQHEVQIEKGFWMGQYTVTFEQYDLFCDETQCKKPHDQGWGRRKHPVISVNWFDGVAYADWLSKKSGRCYRLPTEAEWEYAARAGTTTAFSTGSNINISQAHYVDDREQQTKEVGSYEHNPWNLYDVHGNIWEWTASIYQENYEGEELNNSSAERSDIERTVRGGSWVNYATRLRSAMRRSYAASLRYGYMGFRISLHDEGVES